MNVFEGDYFDGHTSKSEPVTVLFAGGRIKLIGRTVTAEYDARLVRRSLRIADTPRWLYLPGGGACVTADNAAVDRITREGRYERTLRRWESRPAYAAFAALLVAATFWLLVDKGVPAGAALAARHIPVSAEEELGREALRAFEHFGFGASRLPERRQQVIRMKFAAMVQAAGEVTPYRLEFRSSRVGPNAFALPGGTIIMTDELVQLAKHDAEILGVLAHEIGHVRHRHVMRHLLEGSVTGLIIAGVTGDIASASSIAVSAPTLLLRAKYSRATEREADRHAIQMMRKAGLQPVYFATLLKRLEERPAGRRWAMPSFLSSHPSTDERETLARAAAAVQVVAEENEPPEPIAPAQAAVVADSPEAQKALAHLKRAETLKGSHKHAEAASEYLAAARLGNATAQLEIGKRYWHGVDFTRDQQQALVWLRKAAAQGDPEAKSTLEEALQALTAAKGGR